jgi:hypothetical protein
MIPRTLHPLLAGTLLAAASWLLLSPKAAGQLQPAAPDDDSDWRTAVARKSVDMSDPKTHAQHREIPAADFQILGVPFGPGEIREASDKLGTTAALTLGDANFTSSQACYVPAAAKATDVHLIFVEDGEGLGASVILFGAGHSWNGTRSCAKSSHISSSIATANGLHLGLTLAEVKAILGAPSKATPDRLEYSFRVRKKTSVGKLQTLRGVESYMTDAEFHASYDFYNLDEHIVARFLGAKLNYLAVARYQTYP